MPDVVRSHRVDVIGVWTEAQSHEGVQHIRCETNDCGLDAAMDRILFICDVLLASSAD